MPTPVPPAPPPDRPAGAPGGRLPPALRATGRHASKEVGDSYVVQGSTPPQPSQGPGTRCAITGPGPLVSELRRIRTDLQMSITEVVGRLGWPGSKLSRIENRQIGISAADVRKLLDLYGVDDPQQVRELVEMARRSKERGWWESYTTTLPTETRTMIGIETEASLIRAYSQALIPGLLQTPDYAHAVIRAACPTDSQEIVNERVEIRLARQALLEEKEAPRLWVVLSESAIRHVVGSNAIMATQLRSLTKERSRGNVELQVLPFSAGEHPAMVGSFWLYGFPAPNELGPSTSRP
ncbi:helix-turn-helix domain-containing protein [Actinomadura sp. CNU-125]|uniref:helix-turn-helix domain-containing protein n=1 Tax=Actinomadura sp. CNU-125 TaxID=1904961 RepID=UPI0009FA0E10|nr:helix-turn-helix transcriptional regulator [Actinomadura sp. CNU-125]